MNNWSYTKSDREETIWLLIKNINSPTFIIFRISGILLNMHWDYKNERDMDSALRGFISIRYKQMMPRPTNATVTEWKVESVLIN